VRRTVTWWYTRRIEKELHGKDLLKTRLDEKLEELKEKSDYYTTQQLLQRYDSKSSPRAAPEKVPSPPIEHSSSYVRQRIPLPPPPTFPLDQPPPQINIPQFHPSAFTPPPTSPASPPAPKGVFDRLLDLLVGEDETSPEHRYALICSRCRTHNGLAPPGETALQVGYICARCGQWNGPETGDGRVTTEKLHEETCATMNSGSIKEDSKPQENVS